MVSDLSNRKRSPTKRWYNDVANKRYLQQYICESIFIG